MLESWRWYGPFDKIKLAEIAQTGASGIVTALHEIPYGEVWPVETIRARQSEIAESGLGLHWAVVESLPVHENIKRGEGDLTAFFANYRQSLANLAACGIRTVCYNFMPLLDWTRTRLDAPVSRGGTCLRFEAHEMAAFEVHMLKRRGAEADYPPEVLEKARTWHETSDENTRQRLLAGIMAGLPGAYDRYDVEGLRQALEHYEGIGHAELQANYARFLAEIVPAAEELGMRLCVHPDDPPRDILGLPRIVSSEEDVAWVLAQQDARANGLTLCSGSLGANPANDVPAIARRFADRIHFAHLRNVRKDSDGSFEEAAHLEGDTDMVALVAVLIGEEARRRAEGRPDWTIPFRPDHGHELLSDIGRGTHPGYPLIGRMRGLAELRGIVRALTHERTHFA
ncbi:mannonate dehydratase [Ensifer sp. LCM 4579]|uniref:mannonate dehydratase n=1 Tax=Ensifer sp. LCM 4579 TaxID=1848292 RepID=UPI0008DA43B4|nr:mannonate dehydratase [Ensifer sp. LCM 4579]OHV78598.1 mannonate dehydratase [Ensifer sp. LCM 4579]